MTIYRNLSYLDKFRFGERFALPHPSSQLTYSLVWVYEEEANLLTSLHSLQRSQPPQGEVEVMLVLWAAKDSDSHKQEAVAKEVTHFIQAHSPNFPIHLLKNYQIPEKKAGPGLARKIGMDEALSRFLDLEGRHYRKS